MSQQLGSQGNACAPALAHQHTGSGENSRPQRVFAPLRPALATSPTLDDEWLRTLSATTGTRYRGSSPSRPRRGRIQCPEVVVRGHVCGHQCASLSPQLLQKLGGRDQACRHLCTVKLDVRDGDFDNPAAGLVRWRGEQWWVERIVSKVFDNQYRGIRHLIVKRRGGSTGGGVKKDACLKVASVMARYADWDTGRNCRVTNRLLCEETGLSLTQVGRVRLALLLMGVATEVLRGRPRSRVERMASWRLGDRARGWASVWALHPPRGVVIVDNAVDKKQRILAGQSKMATHPRRGLISGGNKTLSGGTHNKKICGNEGAPRRADTRGVHSGASLAPQKALVLALHWLADEQTPAWARGHHPTRWADVLVPAAEHGWQASDLTESLPSGVRPRNPLAYVRGMLSQVDLAMPPSLIRRAEAEIEAREQAQHQAAVAQATAAVDELVRNHRERARQAGAAAVGGEGHRKAREVLLQIGKRVAENSGINSRAPRPVLGRTRTPTQD